MKSLKKEPPDLIERSSIRSFTHRRDAGIAEVFIFPLKSLLDAGVTLASANDYPVQVSSPPLLVIQLGVTRCIPGKTNPDEILGPGKRMSLKDFQFLS
jgi:hypothetical protein